VPEDRFGDLGRRGASREPGKAAGAGGGDGQREGAGASHDPLLGDDPRSAAERLAELDERRPPEPLADADAGAGGRPRGRRGRYLGLVAVAFAALILIAAFNSARNLADDRDLLRGLPAGARLPDFAAPLATGTLEGDANVKASAGGSDAAGARPACEVRSPAVVNICELRQRGPVVLTFIVTRGADCAPELATIERIRREFPGVTFVAVVSGSEREDVARLVRERGLAMPVAVDRDAALVNLYRVGVCPTTVFAARGGVVRETLIGRLADDELRRAVRALPGSSGR
jgi:hypothetical protein